MVLYSGSWWVVGGFLVNFGGGLICGGSRWVCGVDRGGGGGFLVDFGGVGWRAARGGTVYLLHTIIIIIINK